MKSIKNSATNLQKYQINTIDEKHTEMLEKFRENETTTIPSLLEEIITLKNKIKTLNGDNIEQFFFFFYKIYSLK